MKGVIASIGWIICFAVGFYCDRQANKWTKLLDIMDTMGTPESIQQILPDGTVKPLTIDDWPAHKKSTQAVGLQMKHQWQEMQLLSAGGILVFFILIMIS